MSGEGGDPACWRDRVCERCGRVVEAEATCGCAPTVLLVDAANVVGSRPDGWWRDRPGAARRLVEQLRTAATALGGPVVVVLEGQARQGAPAGTVDGVDVIHAPGEGDDTLVALAERADVPVTIVSADRGLADRVRRAGGDVVGPSWLLDRLDG